MCLVAVSATRAPLGAWKEPVVMIIVHEMWAFCSTGRQRQAIFSVPICIGMTGEVLYSDTITRQKLMFDMEGRIPKNSEVTMAELKLFKKPLDRANLPAKQSHRPVSNARVSVYWVQRQHDGTNRTSLIDSR